MAEGGAARGWQFLRRNDLYEEAGLSLGGGAPSFLDAPFPIRRQTEADLEAGPWGLLAITRLGGPARGARAVLAVLGRSPR